MAPSGLAWPAVEVSLPEAVAKRGSVEDLEVLVESPHLGPPLLGERPRTHDQHALDPSPRLELLEDQARLDRLSDADVVSDQKARPVGTEQSKTGLYWKGT